MKHTKREWLINVTDRAISENPNYFTINIKNEKGEKKLIALVYIQLHGSPKQMDEDKANAKLIAAAPELLEALIKAKKLIKDWHNMGTEDMGDGLWTIYEEKSPEMQPINNAIKKATQ